MTRSSGPWAVGKGGQCTSACPCTQGPDGLDEGGFSSKTIPHVFGFESYLLHSPKLNFMLFNCIVVVI